MIRVVFFLAIGILAAIYTPLSLSVGAGAILLIAGTAGYVLCFFAKPSSAWNNILGILGAVLIVLAGFVRTTLFSDISSPHHLTHYTGDTKGYVARIASSPRQKKKTWQYEVEAERIYDGKTWHAIEGRVMLYIAKTGHAPFSYGDAVLVQGAPQALDPPRNPYVFDYQRFLKFKNMYHRHMVDTAHVRQLPSTTPHDLYYYAYAVRAWAARQLSIYIYDKQARSVALALTLGISDSIDNDLRKAYAAGGVMHVLAVSGLHVGILYGIIMLLLLPLRSVSRGRWISATVSIGVLWMYAFLTGLSPSVLRAVTMFSCIALARLLGRNANIYNTIAVSAFLLLLFNPYLIVSVGFQLSYMALLGIVSLYRPLYLLWTPRFVLFDWMWSVSCVSVSAQIGTAALVLFYFHQFSIYFLFANLFVLPAAPVILVGSISVILAGALPPVASLLGEILQAIISLLNKALFFIETLPFSVVDRIYINVEQCLLLMVLILFFIQLLLIKKYRYLIMTFVGVLAFVCLRWTYLYTEILPGRLVVYALPGKTAVEWIEKGRSYFYSDYRAVQDDQNSRFALLPNRVFCGVCDTCTRNVWIRSEKPVAIFYRNAKRIAVVSGPIREWPDSVHVDILVIGNQAFPSLAAMRETIPFDSLILSSSNTKRYCERILKDDRQAITYSVPHRGAYEAKL